MHFGVLKEVASHEKRVAITPQVAKKLIDLGYTLVIESDAGKQAGYPNNLYESVGCKIEKMRTKVLQKEIVACLQWPEAEDLKNLKKGSVLLGIFKPHAHAENVKAAAEQGVTIFSLDLIPRITRAQSMDVLSSQSNLAGYKAVVDAASNFGRAFPLMMTAAGTVPAAKVLILGAGVAGLQAIATAKRLGAIVSAFDVRTAAKEQVESLGATFVMVDSTEAGDGAGGYAKEMGDDYKKAQQEKLQATIKTQDIVISTAQIPGKPAPTLITEDMVKSMKPGSVIVDLAAESGGNCTLTECGKTITKNGVVIMGPANMPSQIATDASQLYACNIFNFLKPMWDASSKELAIPWDDEIVQGTALSKNGTLIDKTRK
jgi:NAD(P) transhydrogenase subunit alpha